MASNETEYQPVSAPQADTTVWLIVPILGLLGGLMSLLAWLLPLCGCPVALITITVSIVGMLTYLKTHDKKALLIGGIGLVLGLIGFCLTCANSLLAVVLRYMQ